VPKSGWHLGTVRGLFRLLEAPAADAISAESAGFIALFVGAGEGIRTLDPDLGKVVLYP
jgi:hypothetical protein